MHRDAFPPLMQQIKMGGKLLKAIKAKQPNRALGALKLGAPANILGGEVCVFGGCIFGCLRELSFVLVEVCVCFKSACIFRSWTVFCVCLFVGGGGGGPL